MRILLIIYILHLPGHASLAQSNLEQLQGFKKTIYYSPGYEVRAKNIAVLMENAVLFFKNEIRFAPKDTLYILAPQHWQEFASPTLRNVYGFPHSINNSRLVIAAADNDFWRSFLPPVTQLPPQIAAQVKKAYGQPDSTYSMRPFFDLLAIHEMAHAYHAQAELKMHRNWMSELFVNIMLHTYVAEKQPELLPALETFPQMVINAGTKDYTFTSLADFERLYVNLGMGPRNYGWYQCKLHAAAKDIYDAGGKKILIKLWKALKKYQENMTDEQFANMLSKEVHPAVANVYLKWD
jgi:hypothetical protein